MWMKLFFFFLILRVSGPTYASPTNPSRPQSCRPDKYRNTPGRTRTTMWMKHYISKRERINLIQSTKGSLAIHFMSLLPISRMVTLKIEQIQRNFLWGGRAIE